MDFFHGKVLFITGATGFLGKNIVFKLLKSCSCKSIYTLMRRQGSKPLLQRYEDYIRDTIFTDINENQIRKVVIPIEGDLLSPKLGLKDADLKLLMEEVEIVIHSAADVRFDTSLSDVYFANVEPTLKVFDLCENMIKVKALVFVSSIIAFFHHNELNENIPSLDVDINELLEILKSGSESSCNLKVQELITKHPNTYSLSKTVTETILKQRFRSDSNFALIITRVGGLMPSLREPVKGWCDKIQILTALVFAYPSGLLQVLRYRFFLNPPPLIATDICGNAILAAVSRQVCLHCKSLSVFNIMIDAQKLEPLEQLMKPFVALGSRFPSEKLFRLPKVIKAINLSPLFATILCFFHETLFAYLADTILMLAGEKPYLRRKTKKMHKLLKEASLILDSCRVIGTQQFQELWLDACKTDSTDSFHPRDLHYDVQKEAHDVYFYYRRNTLREPDSNIERARLKIRIRSILTSVLMGSVISVSLVPFLVWLYKIWF